MTKEINIEQQAEKPKKMTDFSVEQLKIAVYDLSKQMQFIENQIRNIEQEIANRLNKKGLEL